jgi:mono/diheme cytochrome c family protein
VRELLIAVGVAWSGLAAAAGQDAGDTTVWSGVYSAAQAERGEKRYADQCAMCHGAEMTGGGGVPGLAGVEFLFGWNNKSLADLLEYLKQNMPPTQPGGLSDTQYAEVIAAILKANKVPAAATGEMPTDRAGLGPIRITREKG